ncbi:ABC transporter ATP-binding protein [Kribbella solani]|uniref:Oligopeptide/dipeptide ABC transporter ATP-binding protein n=1 Tax=Kribbella solani TaxID=236067 RepID=A0A841DYI9_9ACTN|nr:ABC transporter ATP-binding protein [Kribbella solani]MBB5983722.1 oligopeptide/dipeptide ABC transporter ATP-binding protein [Kribbella solani]
MTELLEVSGLNVALEVDGESRPVLRDVSFRIGKGETVGLVGESGSGKSMTARAVARLLPAGAEVRGSIRFGGLSVAELTGSDLRRYRSRVGMVFQDPRAHINPVRTVGDFLTEALRLNRKVRRSDAEERAVRMLGEVGIADGARRLRQYPHELSGGLLQRVMIASVLLSEPELVLADEPTTALDVTTQSEVMAILQELSDELGLAMLFITHDLELAAAVCDRTVVMYAGQVMETQTSECLQNRPLHPYTSALMASRPSLTGPRERPHAVPGRPLSAFEVDLGCPFAPRCTHADELCLAEAPGIRSIDDGEVACHHVDELRKTSR